MSDRDAAGGGGAPGGRPAAGADQATPNGDGTGGAGPQRIKVIDRRFSQMSEDEMEAEPEAQGKPTYIERLEAQLAEKNRKLREEVARLEETMARGLEEARARLSREAEVSKKAARADLAAPMMDVLEALERTIDASAGARDVAAVVEGVRNVYRLMVQKLGAVGVARIEAQGARFDPAQHEAIAAVPVTDPEQDGVVLDEVAPGFKLDGRVIRPARVRVGKLQRG